MWGDAGRWRKVEEGGGRWWTVVEGGGRWWKVAEGGGGGRWWAVGKWWVMGGGPLSPKVVVHPIPLELQYLVKHNRDCPDQ